MIKQFVPFALAGVLFTACSGNNNSETTLTDSLATKRLEFFGNTQGTTFSIICNDPIDITIEEIESILRNFDLALSAYIPNSTLSQLNDAPAGTFEYRDSFNYFNRCYLLSQELWQLSERTFDPTVYPLVNGWGFLKDPQQVPDSSTVDSLRSLVGFGKGINFTLLTQADSMGKVFGPNQIIKHNARAKLDFNAIAQGIAVDVLAEELVRRGAKNYFVEIGGEIRVGGRNTEGNFWSIGIDKPIENSSADERELQEIVYLTDRSVATSGSYRKFYEKDGIKYSHTIDPFTGYPVQHSLLSATVVADDCGTADALATALMVMGPDKSIQFLSAHPELKIEAYLIFNNDKGRLDTFATPGFAKLLEE